MGAAVAGDARPLVGGEEDAIEQSLLPAREGTGVAGTALGQQQVEKGMQRLDLLGQGIVLRLRMGAGVGKIKSS